MTSPQFTLYSHAAGPNDWKVAFVLKALGLTYETKYLDFARGEHKDPAYTSQFNPNGRVPTLVDHSRDDFTVWESNAITLYLVDTYDTAHKISVNDPQERTKLIQWLFFQSSGQGPYFGQAYHFSRTPETIPYAVNRYANEIERVTSVLDSVLAKSPSGYLVGNKPTVADLSFITWTNIGLGFAPKGMDLKAKYPAFAKWHDSLLDLPYVKEAFKDKAALASQ